MTEEGNIFDKAIQAHGDHLRTHKCSVCKRSLETVLKAITIWLEKENENVKQEEVAQKGQREGEEKGAEKDKEEDGKEKDWRELF